MIIPLLIVALMWLVMITVIVFDADISSFGIFPRAKEGLAGVLLSPFIHSDFKHLFNNTLPLFFLSTVLFYFYPGLALRLLGLTWIITGILVWLGGREAWHIGASGIVYGLASFMFFSGIIRKHFRLVALSLLIVFMYGEMVWGIFPGFHPEISWESHMLGFFSGAALAVLFRKEGPQAPIYDWMEDEEDETENTGDLNELPGVEAKPDDKI